MKVLPAIIIPGYILWAIGLLWEMKGSLAIIIFFYASGHRHSMNNEGLLSYNRTVCTLMGIGLLWNMKDISAIVTLLIHFWAEDVYEQWRVSLLWWCVLYTSGHRNSMTNEGCLSYCNTFNALVGIGILWNTKDVSAMNICFVHFWEQEFYETLGTSQLWSYSLCTSGHRNFMKTWGTSQQ